MELNIQNINNRASWLINLIKTRFLTTEGLLARNYPPGRKTLFDNFDDLAPFFVYFNETDFLLSQVKLIRKLKLNICDVCSDDGVLVMRNIDEWFGGINAIWQLTGDDEVYELLVESVEFIKGKILKNDFLSAAYYLRQEKRVDYYESWSSGLLETFCEMREDFPELFTITQKVMKKWLEHEYFQKYRLFPYRVFISPVNGFLQRRLFAHFAPAYSNSRPPFLKKENNFINYLINKKRLVSFGAINGWYSQLVKSNSTAAFTLLEIYNITGDVFWIDTLGLWIKSAIDNFCDEGKVYHECIPQKKLKLKPALSPAFILIDVICDSAYFYPKYAKYLPKVKEIIDFYWGKRLVNGLVPESVGGLCAHIDNQIDFAVSIRRYAELSKDKSYLGKSLELTRRVLAQHYTPEGYLTYSGEVVKNKIDPKYNALLLKGLINLLTLSENLYPKYHSLFKDR